MSNNGGGSDWDHYETYIVIGVVGLIAWIGGGIWAEPGSTAELLTQLCGVVAILSGSIGVWALGEDRRWWGLNRRR